MGSVGARLERRTSADLRAGRGWLGSESMLISLAAFCKRSERVVGVIESNILLDVIIEFKFN